MAINLRTPQAETRDQRLGTITQWEGGAAELARDSAFTYGCGRDCGQGGAPPLRTVEPLFAGVDVRRADRGHQRHHHQG